MKLDASDRRAAVLGLALAMIGIAVLSLAMCWASPPKKQMEIALMGYTNGTDCFNANCKLQQTLLDCASCCVQCTTGMAPEEKEICIGLCVAHHGGTGSAYDQLVESGEILRRVHERPVGTDVSSVVPHVEYQKHRHLVRMLKQHPHKPLAMFASGLAEQLGLNAVES